MVAKTDFIAPDFLKAENRPVQYFTEEYIAQCKKMSLEEIVDKISEQQDFFWQMHLSKNFNESVLISLKIPKNLLKQFRKKCEVSGVKYQSQIKSLMIDWMLK